MKLRLFVNRLTLWLLEAVRRLWRYVTRAVAIPALLLFGAATIVTTPSISFADLPLGVRVVDSAASGGNDGTSWEDAYEDLTTALAAAAASSGSITQLWVAASATPYVPSAPVDPNELPFFGSTYGPDDEDRMPTFTLVKNVGIYGGFLGNAPGGDEDELSDADPVNNVTILSGDLNGDDDEDEFDDNAYHVLFYYHVAIDNTPPDPEVFKIDGFTITGGRADGGQDSSPYAGPLNAIGGGALVLFEAPFEWYEGHPGDADPGFAEAGAPVFSRCVFENNSAEAGGGAIAGVYNGGRVIDCTFRHNTQTAPSGTGTQFGKTTNGGGAITVLGPVAILRSTFIENESATIGGGDYHIAPVTNDDVVFISNCTFHDNTPPNGGGAIYANEVHGCTFVPSAADVRDGVPAALMSHDRRGADALLAGVRVFLRSLTVAAR